MPGTRVVTGLHPIEAAIAAGAAGILLVERDAARTLLQKVRGNPRIRVERVDREELRRRSGIADARQAALILAQASAAPPSLREFLQTAPERSALAALDGVTDVGNVGAIIRSALLLGLDGLILPSRRSARPGPDMLRASAGAAAILPLLSVAGLDRAILDCQEAGYWVLVADAQGQPLRPAQIPSRVLLVLGSEDSGASRLVRERADELIAIPMPGSARGAAAGIDSLNVSVSAGILFSALGQRPGA